MRPMSWPVVGARLPARGYRGSGPPEMFCSAVSPSCRTSSVPNTRAACVARHGIRCNGLPRTHYAASCSWPQVLDIARSERRTGAADVLSGGRRQRVWSVHRRSALLAELLACARARARARHGRVVCVACSLFLVACYMVSVFLLHVAWYPFSVACCCHAA